MPETCGEAGVIVIREAEYCFRSDNHFFVDLPDICYPERVMNMTFGGGTTATIVVVNDDNIQLNLLCSLLKAGQEPFTVMACTSADEALQRMETDDAPDLIITDLHMPGIDGWRFCRLLRSPEYETYNAVPILVVSATYSGEDARRITRDAGADSFLHAPVRRDDLLEQVLALLAGDKPTPMTDVLIVEDSKSLSFLLEKAFKAHHYRVYTAVSGGEGLLLYRKRRPEVVVLDYHLPDMPGNEILEQIKEGNPQAAIIVITSDPRPDLALACMQKGASAYIRKPFNPEYLITLCENARRERSLLFIEDILRTRTSQLRESESRYRVVFENAPDMMQAVDGSGRLYEVNRHWLREMGYRRSDVVGRRAEEFMSDESIDQMTAQIIPYYWQAESLRDVPCQYVKKDGTVMDVLINSEMVTDATGQKVSLCVLRDVTEQKRMEAALRESEERYRSLVEGMPIPFIVHSEGRLVYANQEALEEFGVENRETVVGTPVLDHIHPDCREMVRERIRILYEKKETVPLVEERFLRMDGTPFDAEVKATGIVYRGKPASQVVFRDITERKRAEAERLKLESQIQKFESLSVMAGSIAHNFNNMLMGIQGNLEMALIDLPGDAPIRSNIDEALRATGRAADLSGLMLTFAGKNRMEMQRLNLTDVAGGLTEILDVAVSEKISLQYQSAQVPLFFKGDPVQINQLLTNLVTNATESFDDGGGTITISTGMVYHSRNEVQQPFLKSPLPEGEYVCLAVADTGSGISPEDVDKVFDPFFTTKFTGRGLGLAAVLGVIRAHNGGVSIDSEPGRGTTIRVYFPAEKIPKPPRPKPVQPAFPGISFTGTILLVDDDPMVLSVGRRMLLRLGFDVLTAGDGCEGMAVFQERKEEISCVILDLTMPCMDGTEVLRALHELRPDLPVILSSGYTEEQVSRRLTDIRPAAFLQKPFQMNALARQIERVLQDRGRKPDQPAEPPDEG